MEIHIQLAGIQLGPYSEKQVREYVAEGLLSMTDKAREVGSLQWIDVSELMAKLPPAAEPAPAAKPNAVFVDEEVVPLPTPDAGAPAQSDPEPKPAPSGFQLPPREVEENKNPASAGEDPFTAKTRPLGPVAPTTAIRPAKNLTASKSVSTTAPLAPLSQATKKMSRTALARALQNKTEPMPGRATTPAATPPTEVPAVSAGAPDTTGPMSSGVAEEPAPPPATEPRKGAGFPSLLKSLAAKTVPLRKSGAPEQPAAPPVPGGSTMPVTTPLPTKAIINPAANRARRPANPPPSPPEPEIEKPTEKLPVSKKAAELRARQTEKLPPPEPKAEPKLEAEPAKDEASVEKAPRRPRRWSRLLIGFFGLLALVGAAYVWLPYHASSALRGAMASGNAADLERMVDFDAVQTSLKQQVHDFAGAQASADMLNKSIDSYVTPTGISNLVAKSGQFSPDETNAAISPEIAGNIINSFVQQPPTTQGLASPTDFVIKTSQANLHLTLHGLGWKLTRIDIRPDLPTPAGAGGAPAVLVPVMQTYLKRGQTEAANSDWKSAVSDFSQALAIAPQSSDAYNARGAALSAKGDLDGAVKDFTQALAIDPQSAAAYNGRGTAHMAKGDLDGAIGDFTQAIKIDPTNAVAYDNRGNAKSAKNDLDGAIKDFTQAITIDPTLANAYSDRGLARQANGNLDGAIKDYSDALNLKPKSPGRTYFSRGQAYLSQSNIHGAILDFDRALSFDPKLADAYFQRGNAKSVLHDTDGAIVDFTQTLALNPKNALAYCGRGVAREDKGDLDGAQSDYTTALSLNPKIAIAYFRRALIEIRKNDPDGAIADTTQSLDLDPKNTQAYYYRGFAKMVRNNLDGAQSDLQLFCEAAPHDRFADNARLYIWIIAKLQNAHIDADQDLSDSLENSWNNSAEDFTAKTAGFLLGRVTEADYLTAASSTDGSVDATQHCQAYYFAGMKRLLMGDKDTASDYFQKCVATGKKDFCEYILAQAQLQSPSVPVTTPVPVLTPPALVPTPAATPPAATAPAPAAPTP